MTDQQQRRSHRGGKPALSEEDRLLWDHVARSVLMPRRSKPRVPDIPEYDLGHGEGDAVARLERQLRNETAKLPAMADQSKAQANRTAPRSLPASPHPTQQRTPPLADFDRKAVRRIRSGRIDIEARIDLHGMRQDEALGALRAFLYANHARGVRWVLVITGKRTGIFGGRCP